MFLKLNKAAVANSKPESTPKRNGTNKHYNVTWYITVSKTIQDTNTGYTSQLQIVYLVI